MERISEIKFRPVLLLVSLQRVFLLGLVFWLVCLDLDVDAIRIPSSIRMALIY